MDINSLSSWGLSKAIYDIIENGFSFDEETGEVLFTGDDLEKLEETLDNKLNGVCGFIKFTEGQVDALKKRKSEIEDNIKFYSNREERLKEFLKRFMEINNISKKELADYRLGTRKSSSIEITDEALVMDFLDKNPQYKETCLKVETTTKIVKPGLKDVLAEKQIPGAQVVERNNVTIK